MEKPDPRSRFKSTWLSPRYFNRLWLWVVVWLLCLFTTIILQQLRPVTFLDFSELKSYSLAGLNSTVNIEVTQFQAEKKVDRQINGFRLQMPVFSYRPLKLLVNVADRQSDLNIFSNNQLITTFRADQNDGQREIRFTPEKVDNNPELNIRLESEGNFTVSYLALDLNEGWGPVINPAGLSDLTIALILLSLLFPFGVVARIQRWKWLGLIGLGLGAYAVVRLFSHLALLYGVGQGGQLNDLLYWLWFCWTAALVGVALTFMVAVVPVAQGQSLSEWATPVARRLASRYPFAAAVVILTLFNTTVTGVLYGALILQNHTFDNVVRFWDGPEYLAIAHSLYNTNDAVFQIGSLNDKSHLYWAAHFPLYPLLIRLLSGVMGYLPAMLLPNFLFGTGFAVVVYRLLREFNYCRYPLWVAAASLILPLRWLIYHSVGASEGMALFFLMLCIYQFKRERYWQAGLWGAVVVWTRPNGIFLYAGLMLFLAWQTFEVLRRNRAASGKISLRLIAQNFNWKAALPLGLLPLAFVGVFVLYAATLGDFLAYFHIPEDVKHTRAFPLVALNVDSGRSEADFYYFLLEAAGMYLLWKARRFDLFWIGLALGLPTFFVYHDDVLRYSLPAFPMLLLVPFAGALESRFARRIAPLVLFGVLLYSVSQLQSNMIPAGNWRELYAYLNR